MIEFIRFFFVGGFCYLLSMVLLYISVDFLKINYLISMVALWPVVNLAGFFLNKIMTFKKKRGEIVTPLVTYNLFSILSFCTALLLMYFLVSVSGLNYIVANMFVGFTMMFVNFMFHKKVTFGKN